MDVETALSVGGTGRSTGDPARAPRWLGLRQEGILKSKDSGAAFGRDWGQVDPDQGGVFGPRGGVNFATGKGTLLDVHSIDNFKKMMATNIATTIATLVVVEYVREVAAERVQKHWYDEEKCLKVDAAPATTRLRANATTTVTAKNARAASGAPVASNLTASGTQSLGPGRRRCPRAGARPSP